MGGIARRLRTNNRGVAFVMAIFLVAVLVLLVVAFYDMMTTDQLIVTNYVGSLKTLYTADAGVEEAVYELRQDETYSGSGGDVEFPAGSGNYYNVTLSGSTIISTGRASGRERTIQAVFDLTPDTDHNTVKILTWSISG